MSLVALGIGNIIGAGIFVLTGQAAAAHAGPAIGLSFMISAIACAFAGMCYAEMASSVPISGSAYTYAYATMGEIIAWIIGWDLLLEYALGAATVAIGWSGYVVSFLKDFGIPLRDIWTAAPFDFDPARGEWQRTAALINAPAMLVTAIASMLLVVGIHESAKVNNFIVVVKVGIVIVFIFVSIWFVNPANWVTASNPDGAAVQDACGVVRPSGRSRILGFSDVRPARRDVGATRVVASGRSCALFPLRRAPQPARSASSIRARTSGVGGTPDAPTA